MIALTVISAFEGYAKGDSITDPVTISRILAGHNQRDVLKISAPDIDDMATSVRYMMESLPDACPPIAPPQEAILPQFSVSKKQKQSIEPEQTAAPEISTTEK